jgi:hypothetical protein
MTPSTPLNGYHVRCNRCEVYGPSRDNIADAVAKWNGMGVPHESVPSR